MTKFMRNGFISAWLPSDRKTAYLQEFDRVSLYSEIIASSAMRV